jgi:hypothetical protein
MDRVKLSRYRVLAGLSATQCCGSGWIRNFSELVGSGMSSVDPSYGSKTGPAVFDVKKLTVFQYQYRPCLYTFFLRETWLSLKNLVEALLCTLKNMYLFISPFLLGSDPGADRIQNDLKYRFQNKSFRIHNTANKDQKGLLDMVSWGKN